MILQWNAFNRRDQIAAGRHDATERHARIRRDCTGREIKDVVFEDVVSDNNMFDVDVTINNDM